MLSKLEDFIMKGCAIPLATIHYFRAIFRFNSFRVFVMLESNTQTRTRVVVWHIQYFWHETKSVLLVSYEAIIYVDYLSMTSITKRPFSFLFLSLNSNLNDKSSLSSFPLYHSCLSFSLDLMFVCNFYFPLGSCLSQNTLQEDPFQPKTYN